MSEVTATHFVDLVRKSGLITRDRLVPYLTDVEPEPEELAEQLVRDGLLTGFQAGRLLRGKAAFDIGNYRILERIGVGSLGQVFLAEHRKMRSRVAVKVLEPLKALDGQTLARFYREGRAAAAVEHPNLVHVSDLDQDGNLHFLVMEYVDGTSLQEVVARHGPLSPARAAHYVAQAAAALQHAYERGLVHRDVKPANLMVNRQGIVKVLDLGLARFFLENAEVLTVQNEDGQFLGAADYVAPEQTSDSHNVDTRADVYSLGCTFYFLLTGQPPFPDGDFVAKLLAHRQRPPRPIRDVRPGVPEDLAAVVHRMLAKDPADRYQMPQDVAAALTEWTALPIDLPAEAEMPRLCLRSLVIPSASPRSSATDDRRMPGSHADIDTHGAPQALNDTAPPDRTSREPRPVLPPMRRRTSYPWPASYDSRRSSKAWAWAVGAAALLGSLAFAGWWLWYTGAI